ncbi:excitatory amino acid transporter 3-like [Pseudoliparis swirei]|uniref:excitatory amino acid transporter 3-like n=1 Tax=Pseudoliparis swirei TaxID=2059687 RepID=UPI0024BDA141|nr:excitatory amino acid transporter 3-like [Pseudoliparis swirei]
MSSIALRYRVEENDVDPRIAHFLLPIAATVNKDGSALYEVVAVVFLAQLSGIELSLSRIIEISVLADISSISAAGTPATGAVTTLFVLEAVGLPTKNASILFAVKWILDRLKTVVNVGSDCVCVEIVDVLSQRELEEEEQVTFSPRIWDIGIISIIGISSLCAAGIRATGAVTTLFVLEAVGLPTESASILFTVKWIL